MVNPGSSIDIFNLLRHAEDLQAQGRVNEAYRQLERAKFYLGNKSSETWKPIFDKIYHKLMFQRGHWDPQVFDKDRILSLAENHRPEPRYIMGMLWRVALKEQESPDGNPKTARFLFDAHERISRQLGIGHLSGNGIYVSAHSELLKGSNESIRSAMEKLRETARHFSAERPEASRYFKPYTKLAHLLATLSIAFSLVDGDKRRSYFCLSLAGLILDGNNEEERVIVRHGAGLEAFVRLAQQQHPSFLSYLEENPERKRTTHRELDELHRQFRAAQYWRATWHGRETEESIVNTIFDHPGCVVRKHRALTRTASRRATSPKAQIVVLAEHIKGDIKINQGGNMAGDNTYNVNQAGAVGPNAQASNMTFNQIWHKEQTKIDLIVLQADLALLRQAMRKEATSLEQDAAVGEIASAEYAAQKQDGPAVIQHLKTAGKWALDVAEKIGVNVATEALKAALNS